MNCTCKIGKFEPTCPCATPQDMAKYNVEKRAQELWIAEERRYRDMLGLQHE